MEPTRESSLSSSVASFAATPTNQGESEVSYSDARSSSDTLHLRAVHSSDEVLSGGYVTPNFSHDQRASLSIQLSNYLKEIGETERRVGIVNLSDSITEFISKKNQLHPDSSLDWNAPVQNEKNQTTTSSSISSSGSAVIQSLQGSKKKQSDETEETEDDDYEGYETSHDDDQMKMEEFKQKWMMTADDKAWIISTNLDEFPCVVQKQMELEETDQELDQTNVDKERTTNLSSEKLQLDSGPSQVDEDESNLIAQLDLDVNKLTPDQIVRGMTFPRTGESPSQSDSQPWKTWPMRAKANGPSGRASLMQRFLDRLLCRKKRNRPKTSEGGSATKSKVPTLSEEKPQKQPRQFGLSKAQEKELRFISKFYNPTNNINYQYEQYARWPTNSVKG